MYLFHAISTYQLLEMIVFKTKFHKDDKCVLMITDTVVDKFPAYKKLDSFFDEIIVYPIAPPPSSKKSLPENCSSFFDSIFKKHKLSINSFDEIYVGCAHYYFGIYLASYNIPFVFFEDAAGIQSRWDILVNIEKEKYPIKQRFNLELGLYDGSNPAVKKIICNHNSQTDEVKRNTEHFDVVATFLELDESIQNEVREFFIDIDKIDIPENATLFLTQHLANMQVLSFDDHVLLYQLVFDYFFKDKTVVLKPHPDDIMHYGILFPKCQIIRQRFPAEFLPVMFVNKPKEIATVSSTAIFNLQNSFDETFFLDTRTEKDFKALHRYFVALMLHEAIAKDASILQIGVNECIINELCRANNITVGDTGNFYIIDDIEAGGDFTRENIISLLENMKPNDSAIFINFKNDYCFYDINHKEIFKSTIPITIKKRKQRDDEFYSDTNTETIYFYSKNEEYRKMAENMELNKTLENTGLEISLESLTPEQRQIKALEGTLKATEARLLYYINRVKELENEGKK